MIFFQKLGFIAQPKWWLLVSLVVALASIIGLVLVLATDEK